MPNPARLMVDGPDRWVVTHEVDPNTVTVIGRNEDCTIVLKGMGVSGRHAEIRHDGKAWSVRDLESRNGTLVNGNKISGEQKLRDGDVIGIKPFSLTWKDVQALRPDQTLSGISIDALLAKRKKDTERVLGAGTGTMTGLLPRAGIKPMAGAANKLPTDGVLAQTETRLREVEKERDGLRVENSRLSLKMELLRQIMVSPSETACYRELLESAASALGAQVAFLMLIDPETKRWEVRAQTKTFEDLSERTSGEQRPPISLGIVSKALTQKKALLASEADDGDGASASMARNEIKACIAAPILEGDQPVGCLYFDRREKSTDATYDDDSLDLATMLAPIFAEAAQFFVLRGAFDARAEQAKA